MRMYIIGKEESNKRRRLRTTDIQMGRKKGASHLERHAKKATWVSGDSNIQRPEEWRLLKHPSLGVAPRYWVRV